MTTSSLEIRKPNDTENEVLKICKEVLLVESMGIKDDFFSLGADSISLVEIQIFIEQHLGKKIDWSDVLRFRNVESLSAFIDSTHRLPPQDKREIEWRGVKYAFRVIGDINISKTTELKTAVPKLVIAGGFQNMYSLPHLEYLLKDDGPLIMVDLPGTGSADDVPDNESFAFLAECVRHILDVLSLQTINLIGISYGGSTALEFAYRWPERINKAVLIGAALTQPPHIQDRLNTALQLLSEGKHEESIEKIISSILCLTPGTDILGRDTTYKLLKTTLQESTRHQGERYESLQMRLLNQKQFERADNFNKPILFTTGEHDIITPPENVRSCASIFPNSTFTTIKKSDHLVMVERPDVLADLLIRFFNGRDLTNTNYLNDIELVN
ncbi:putative hybrid non-ribosomal peptide-polyketide synthetase [Xenorhabdus vietnamensis]|uniref:Putative hybrid non-ribosomal peptide-polyketide synthetase n=1 Tax=Xenorhabdus vietnamensis TaxID=351656 RepID=A0A1Y2SE15_9GAMM|nr:alpha/beta fold hydrolase [Xenorhabdus vietnamensis]OTA16514.1 putative hybrid non-ribosomal peptide-polyketide synthetase [Xenorhabdus vietnamensis]